MKSIKLLCLLVLLISAPLVLADDAFLLNKIDQAQRDLSRTESRIASERQTLSEQLFNLERELVALRERAAVARRLSDEKTLSLSKLETRLTTWKQQQNYQHNLLERFLQQHRQYLSVQGVNDVQKVDGLKAELKAGTGTGVGVEPRTNSEALQGIHSVLGAARKLQVSFHPKWQSMDVVLDSGEINSLPVLNVGPLTWYWNNKRGEAGIASQQGDADNLLRSDLILNSTDSEAIKSLRETTRGNVVFDPTLIRALAREQHAESLMQHLIKGGMWAVPIIVFAFFALAIALVKAKQLFSLAKYVRFTPAALQSVLQNPSSAVAKNVSGMQKILLQIAQQTKSAQQRDDQLFIQLQDDKHILERWLGGIAITAAISPLLGLLGTVSGMIETFKMMTLFGSGDPEVVSGGIAQALITTELGLVVAIPALILNAVLSRRAKAYYKDLETFAILISKVDEESVLKASASKEPNYTLASSGDEVETKTKALSNHKSQSESVEGAMA